MKKIILLPVLFCLILSSACKKESLNTNPGMVTGFTIGGGASTEYNWTDAIDADGDKLTYDLYLLTNLNSKPVLISKDNVQSKFNTDVFPAGTIKAMIVITKDGRGGESTSVEAPTIFL